MIMSIVDQNGVRYDRKCTVSLTKLIDSSPGRLASHRAVEDHPRSGEGGQSSQGREHRGMGRGQGIPAQQNQKKQLSTVVGDPYREMIVLLISQVVVSFMSCCTKRGVGVEKINLLLPCR